MAGLVPTSRAEAVIEGMSGAVSIPDTLGMMVDMLRSVMLLSG